MTNQYPKTSNRTLPQAISAARETNKINRGFLQFGAGIGLLGGTCLLFGAVFLTVFEYFYSEKPHGNWVFPAVLLLWVLGAVCLDKIEIAEKSDRIEYCKNTGMKDKNCSNGKRVG